MKAERSGHALHAATGKARSPSVEWLIDDTTSVDVAADRRRRRTSTHVLSRMHVEADAYEVTISDGVASAAGRRMKHQTAINYSQSNSSSSHLVDERT